MEPVLMRTDPEPAAEELPPAEALDMNIEPPPLADETPLCKEMSPAMLSEFPLTIRILLPALLKESPPSSKIVLPVLFDDDPLPRVTAPPDKLPSPPRMDTLPPAT
jgi:hypothetical protein